MPLAKVNWVYLSLLLWYSVCLSSLCSEFFFFPLFAVSSVAVSVVLGGPVVSCSSWLACGTFEVPHTCGLPSGYSCPQFLAGGRERIKWLKCSLPVFILIFIFLVKEWIKAELRKYWGSFVVTETCPIITDALSLCLPWVAIILEGFLLSACFPGFESLRFEMGFLSTLKDILFDAIIIFPVCCSISASYSFFFFTKEWVSERTMPLHFFLIKIWCLLIYLLLSVSFGIRDLGPLN